MNASILNATTTWFIASGLVVNNCAKNGAPKNWSYTIKVDR